MRRAGILALAGLVGFALLTAGVSGSSRQLRVAYVTDIVTPAGPHTLRGAALLGFRRAVRAFHLHGRVVQYNPRQGQAPTLASLGRQKYDLVFTSVFLSDADFNAFSAVATRFPKTKFVAPSVQYQYLSTKPKNVQGWIEHVEEPAYLAGYLAALMESRRPGEDVIGSVGGLPVPAVDTFIAGYEAGAKKADPRITTLRSYSNNFVDPAKCNAVARGQIAKGAGVVFDVAGLCGPGTLQAAKEKHVWGIGVDTDQSFRGPHILTSAIHGPNTVYKTVEAFVQGRLKTGGNKIWSLRNGGVGLGRISPKVPRSLVRQVNRIRKQIIAGKIKVPSTLR